MCMLVVVVSGFQDDCRSQSEVVVGPEPEPANSAEGAANVHMHLHFPMFSSPHLLFDHPRILLLPRLLVSSCPQPAMIHHGCDPDD